MISRLMIICIFAVASLQSSQYYVDYWETLQEEKGYLTISSIWTESHPFFSIIRFFITEDEGSHAPMLLTVTLTDTSVIKEAPWEAGDLVFFKWLGEEYYWVSNLRTQGTVIAVEPLGLQH